MAVLSVSVNWIADETRDYFSCYYPEPITAVVVAVVVVIVVVVVAVVVVVVVVVALSV